MRDRESIDSELRLVAALRRAARERGGPLPSIDVADALLDERRELTGSDRATGFVYDRGTGRVLLDGLNAFLGVGLCLIRLAGSDDFAVGGLRMETKLAGMVFA
jgi:hypothetical protein